jgi:hypothetical protein
MTEYIRRLLKAGVVELSKRGPFVANCFILPKKNGETRLVVDYSNITPVLGPPKYYLPALYQVVQRQVFPCKKPYNTKLDLKNAFFNIPIHPKSRHITTFNNGGIFYRLTKMQIGLSLAHFGNK